MRTTGRSKLDPSRPLCSHCQSRRLSVPTLASLSARPSPRKAVQCEGCLATDVPMRNGICKDREACEARQPPLIPLEEL